MGNLLGTTGRPVRPRHAAGLCATILLAPAFFLGAGAAGPPAQFDISSAPTPPPALPSDPPQAGTSPSMWIEKARIEVPAGTPLATSTVSPATAGLLGTTTTIPAEGAAASPAGPATSTTSTTVRPTTTTTAPLTVNLPVTLPPIAPAQRPGAVRVERGQASWFNTADETCAHRTAPFGTVIKVTRLSTGAVTQCTVNDWGPADTTRVIDLSMDTFEKLADAGAGLIEVTIEW